MFSCKLWTFGFTRRIHSFFVLDIENDQATVGAYAMLSVVEEEVLFASCASKHDPWLRCLNCTDSKAWNQLVLLFSFITS